LAAQGLSGRSGAARPPDALGHSRQGLGDIGYVEHQTLFWSYGRRS